MTSESIFSLLPSSHGRAAKLARRLRALPFSGSAQPREMAPLGSVDTFLDQLVDLPLAEWLMIGEALVADRDHVAVRRRAWDELEETLLRSRLGLAVWEIRDAVDTAAFIATRESHRWSRHERRTFAAAHGAAEAAALALLVRGDLPTDTYRALTAPFAASIAVAEATQRD